MVTLWTLPQDEQSLGHLWRGRDAFRPAVGVTAAPRPRLGLALLEIGAELFGKPRLAVCLPAAIRFVPHVPFRAARTARPEDMSITLWPGNGRG